MHLGNSIICPVTGIPMIIAAGAAAFWAFKKSSSPSPACPAHAGQPATTLSNTPLKRLACVSGSCSVTHSRHVPYCESFSDKKAKKDFNRENILPAIALTSFVFALQMINFSVPTTASSGHIVGGLLLAALLGPYAGFLAICSILLVQAVFFADGGLMALGCNIFNMGFLACFVAYPLVYKPLAENRRSAFGAILASIVALQLGSIAVVAESALSGSTSANIGLFASLMQSIHLAIGIVEGVFTAAVILIAQRTQFSKMFSYSISALALILAGVISQFASSKPDGLEWSLINMSDSFVAQTQGYIYALSELIQTKSAILTQLPPVIANIGALAIVTLLMITICKLLTWEKASAYEQQ